MIEQARGGSSPAASDGGWLCVWASETWRRYGIGGLLCRVRARLQPGSRTLVLFGLSQPVTLAAEERSQVDHWFATRDEVARLPAGILTQDSLPAFDRGSRCVLQAIHQRLVGVVWVSTAPVVELHPGVCLSLPSDAVYSFRTWTDPAHRGRGLQGRRHLAILALVRGEGRSRLLCFCESTNLASLRGVRRSGCRPIGIVRMLKAGDPRPTIEIEVPAWHEVTLASR